MSSVVRPLESTTPRKELRWAPLIWFSALMLSCYAIVLVRLGDQWLTNEDMSHGIFVLPLVGYMVWRSWPELNAAPSQPNLWGLFFMILGAILLCIGPPTLPTFAFITRISLLISVFGLLLLLRGKPTIKLLLYPFVISLFMIPLPGFIYERLTLPLQFVASYLAEQSLDTLGYSVLREGNILYMPRQTLSVVEACSGLRSLLSLSFLGQAYIYLFDTRPWMRIAIAIAIIPIAVFANAGRIVFTAVASDVDQKWGHGIYHESAGWMVFVIAFAALLFVHYAINRVCRLRELSSASTELRHV